MDLLSTKGSRTLSLPTRTRTPRLDEQRAQTAPTSMHPPWYPMPRAQSQPALSQDVPGSARIETPGVNYDEMWSASFKSNNHQQKRATDLVKPRKGGGAGPVPADLERIASAGLEIRPRTALPGCVVDMLHGLLSAILRQAFIVTDSSLVAHLVDPIPVRSRSPTASRRAFTRDQEEPGQRRRTRSTSVASRSKSCKSRDLHNENRQCFVNATKPPESIKSRLSCERSARGCCVQQGDLRAEVLCARGVPSRSQDYICLT